MLIELAFVGIIKQNLLRKYGWKLGFFPTVNNGEYMYFKEILDPLNGEYIGTDYLTISDLIKIDDETVRLIVSIDFVQSDEFDWEGLL